MINGNVFALFLCLEGNVWDFSLSLSFIHSCTLKQQYYNASSIFQQQRSKSEWMILKDVLHQHDSNRENSVCSQALNELTFHKANGY